VLLRHPAYPLVRFDAHGILNTLIIKNNLNNASAKLFSSARNYRVDNHSVSMAVMH
jgi:hypothetical protein